MDRSSEVDIELLISQIHSGALSVCNISNRIGCYNAGVRISGTTCINCALSNVSCVEWSQRFIKHIKDNHLHPEWFI